MTWTGLIYRHGLVIPRPGIWNEAFGTAPPASRVPATPRGIANPHLTLHILVRW